MNIRVNFASKPVLSALAFPILTTVCLGQAAPKMAVEKWITVSSNFDVGYRRTQFTTPNYNTFVFQWDTRSELWLPPFQREHRWGPYVRVAGIAGSEPDAFQNGWLGAPGFGIQIYPFNGLLGPLRAFGEYNFTHFWGQDYPGESTPWRPKKQVRAGFDYWEAANVNSTEKVWWMEVWNGLYWQSANEFTNRYDSVLFANSAHLGVRKPGSSVLSTVTPYLTGQSSLSKYRHFGLPGCPLQPDLEHSRDPDNPCDFFWENRFLWGGGIRVAPAIKGNGLLTRFVIYGEYLDTARYYGPIPPSSFPRHDLLVGLSANFGNWYKQSKSAFAVQPSER